MIDPQSQANVWVRNREAVRGELQVLRPSLPLAEQALKLENSMEFGLAVLLENVSESLDQLYNDIL